MGQGHEDHTILEMVAKLPCHLDPKTRLANSARTGERHQPDALLDEQPEYFGLLLLTADEAPEHDRQVAPCDGRRPIGASRSLALHRVDSSSALIFIVRLPCECPRGLR
jgi:hypothetical protein